MCPQSPAAVTAVLRDSDGARRDVLSGSAGRVDLGQEINDVLVEPLGLLDVRDVPAVLVHAQPCVGDASVHVIRVAGEPQLSFAPAIRRTGTEISSYGVSSGRPNSLRAGATGDLKRAADAHSQAPGTMLDSQRRRTKSSSCAHRGSWYIVATMRRIPSIVQS
jgi:hypothetical protein